MTDTPGDPRPGAQKREWDEDWEELRGGMRSPTPWHPDVDEGAVGEAEPEIPDDREAADE